MQGALQVTCTCAHPSDTSCSALACTLQLLKLRSDTPIDLLATTIGRRVQPAALALTAHNPATNMWLPQLQYCNIAVYESQQISQLNSRLEEGSLAQLSSLVLNDLRLAAVRRALPPDLPALALLPSLCKLVRGSEGQLARPSGTTRTGIACTGNFLSSVVLPVQPPAPYVPPPFFAHRSAMAAVCCRRGAAPI